MRATNAWIWTAALALVAMARPAVARTPIDKSASASIDGMVLIKNAIGSVDIQGWDQEEVKVTGTLGEEAEDLDVRTSGSRTHVEVVMPDRWDRHDTEGSDLQISVPHGSRIVVEGVNTTVDVSKVTGRVEVQTVNGDVTIAGPAESVEVHTVNGEVDVEGDVSRVEAEVVGGDIRLTGVRGDIEATSVNGSIHLRGERLERFNSSSVAGDIVFEGTLAPDGTFDFESHSGDVILTLAEDTSAEFDVSTFSGDIDNELGPQARRTSRYAPGKELHFSTGAGEARVRVTTFSGDVEIRRR
jgi:DUF4097 and DUF4098 domain-containing protein YvlB